MRFPTLTEIPNRTKKSIIEWQGLNRKALIGDNELSSCSNLSTKHFPLLSPRPSREAAHTLTAGHALFAATQLAWIDGTDFKYNGTTEGAVTASAKSMVELSGRIVIFPDKKSYDTVSDSFSAFGSGTYPAAESVPDIDYAAVLDNRIWAVKGDNIYASALGEYNNWTTFSSPSEATDAWSVDTGTNGSFTGIASFKGTILAFKADRVYKLFGDVPENFQLIEISRLGCTNHKSIWEVNNTLFWLNDKGIVAYTGGVPDVISDNLNDVYVSGVGGGDGRRYYISLYNGSTYSLYVFDTWKGVWLREDSLQVKDFAYLGGFLYALAADHKIYKFNAGAEVVTWEVVTKEFTEEYMGRKGHSEISLRVDLEANSTLTVQTRIDNENFTAVKTYSTADFSTFEVPIKINRAEHFQLRIVGSGEGKVHQIQRKFVIGAD